MSQEEKGTKSNHRTSTTTTRRTRYKRLRTFSSRNKPVLPCFRSHKTTPNTINKYSTNLPFSCPVSFRNIPVPPNPLKARNISHLKSTNANEIDHSLPSLTVVLSTKLITSSPPPQLHSRPALPPPDFAGTHDNDFMAAGTLLPYTISNPLDRNTTRRRHSASTISTRLQY